jgi:uncharacterized membrane protein
MTILDVALTWVHVLSAVIFLGAMFVGTFVLMPVLKGHVDHANRHSFITHFIPRARSFVRIAVITLAVTGVARALLLHYTHEGPASIERLAVFAAKVVAAVIPIAIFTLAPKVLGKYSAEGLCCDPDAKEPAAYVFGVMTSQGAMLHYVAISAGWVAVLLGIVLSQMH